MIFIGVDDARLVVGRRLDRGTSDAVHGAAREAHDLGRYSLRQVDVAGALVTAVLVERRQQGFSATSDGRILVRRGASKRALVGQDLWDFIASRSLKRFERSNSGLSIQAIETTALERLASAYGWSGLGDDLQDRLEERGLVVEDSLTIAGALCLTDPAVSLGTGKFVVEVLRYGRDEGADYDRREVFGGPVPEQVRSAASFVSAELGSDLVVTGLYRHDVPRLPPRVVREAIANAVAHRSYELDRTAVRVEMRPSRVVIQSPGRLVEPVTVTTMRRAQAARNQDVIAVLRQFRLAEDNGQGVGIMEDQMREALLDDPSFEENSDSVVVSLSLLGPVTPRERAWLAELERVGTLQPADRLSLVVAARGWPLTNAAVRELTGLDRAEATRSLQRLRDAGLIVQHGQRGGATYAVALPIAPPAAYRMTPAEVEALVLDAAAEQPLRNSDVRELTGLDRAETRALLSRLVGHGALMQEGVTRGTTYRRPRS